MFKPLLATAFMAGLCAATPAGAQRLLTQSEKYGDAQDNDRTVLTTLTQNFYDPEALLTRANEIKRNGDAAGSMSLSTYTQYDYDAQGRQTSWLKRQATPTSPDDVDHEYVFVNNNRGFKAYDAAGNLAKEYEQTWQNSRGAWSNSKGKEWDYNADGTVKEQREWIYGYNPDSPANPTNTTTYTYDAQGRVTAAHNDGGWDSNKWDETYTYDADGNKTEAYRVCWSKEPAAFVQRTVYTYDPQGRVVEEITTKPVKDVETNNNRTTYAYPADGSTAESESYTWTAILNGGAGGWSPTGGSRRIDYYSDFTGKASMAPELRVSHAEGTLADLEMMIKVTPDAAAKNARFDVYRDGYLMVSKTVSELKAEGLYNDEGQAACIVMARQPQGQHDYYAQLMLPDTKGGYQGYYVSPVVSYDMEIECPAVTGLKVTGIEKTTKMNADTYHVSVEWTNPQGMDQFGFKRHNLFCNAFGSRLDPVVTDASVTTATLDLDDPSGRIWIVTDYDLGTAKSAEVAYDYASAEGLEAWGFAESATSMNLVKLNLSDPSAQAEKVWDLEDEGVMAVAAGAPVGSGYVGIYDGDNWSRHLATFNFEQQVVQPLRTVEGDDEYNITGLSYDAANDDLYAISYDFDADYNYVGVLQRMDMATSYFERVAEFDAQIDRIAVSGGKIYGVGSPDYENWQLYVLDAEAGAATEIAMAEPMKLGYFDNVNLVAHEGKLYLTVGTQLVTIDPEAATWAKSESDLNRAVAGLTFTFATTDVDITVAQGAKADSRVVFRSTSYGDVMGMTDDNTAMNITNNYYDFDNRLVASVQNDRGIDSDEFSLAYYTANTYNAEGKITKSERKQYGDFDYGMPGFETVQAIEYAYDEAGQLTERRDGDDWNRYTYGAMGELATETIGCGDDTYQVLTYTYEVGQTTNPVLVASASPSHPDWDGNIYWEVREYADNGKIAKATQYADQERTEIRTQTVYTYFDDTAILRQQESFTGNELTPDRRTTWTPVDDDMNKMDVQPESYWDGVWYKESGRRVDEYVDYSAYNGLAEAIDLTAQASNDPLNTAVLAFNCPMYLGNQQGTLDIYRDGQLLTTLTSETLLDYLDPESGMVPRLVYPDQGVRNGQHTYFVQQSTALGAGELDDTFVYQPLQCSDLAEITFDLPLPAVTGLHVTAERTEAVTDPQTGAAYDATFATLAWTSPADAADYGFESNCVLLDRFMTPAAATEGESVDVNIGEAASVTMYVQSRYKYGYVNSESIEFTVGALGIDGAYAADGLAITVAGDAARVNREAQIDVFDMSGRRVATARGTCVDLTGLAGAYVITARAGKAKAAVKIAL